MQCDSHDKLTGKKGKRSQHGSYISNFLNRLQECNRNICFLRRHDGRPDGSGYWDSVVHVPDSYGITKEDLQSIAVRNPPFAINTMKEYKL